MFKTLFRKRAPADEPTSLHLSSEAQAAWDSMRGRLERIVTAGIEGSVVQSNGVTVTAAGLSVPVGATVDIHLDRARRLPAEVIGFQDHLTIVYPLDRTDGIRRGQRIALRKSQREVLVGDGLLGRVMDGLGHPIDGAGPIASAEVSALDCDPAPAFERPTISQPFPTGVRAIDGLLTCGRGQRMGIFSAPGVGKSVMLGMLARDANSPVNVIALIGERGREVNEFLQNQLSEESRARSVVVVATSDQPAVLRARAARTATAIAESFREQGHDVLFLMDSLTRFAMAERETALAAGEPPATRGFPASVFASLPRLIERTGMSARGSITAFYTVLVEGDDPNDPIADAVRGYLDGHLVLSRHLAAQSHYPAIDIVQSVSRLADQVADQDHRVACAVVRRLLSIAYRNRELLMVGAYRKGTDPELDQALAFREAINRFLCQDAKATANWDQTLKQLKKLSSEIAQGCPPER